MRGRFKLAWGACALGTALVLVPTAEGFFHEGDYRRLELKRFDASIVAKCRGDFLVFEEHQAEPREPFVAVLSAPGFQVGTAEGSVKARLEKGKSLAEYARRIGESSNNYFMIAQDVAGTPICGLQHQAPGIFVDAKEKRIDVRGTTKDSSGGGGGGEGGGGGGGY